MAKILLVEDDNNLREIYEARLQAEGYTIVSARDGEEALVVAKAEKPDLIISDIMMPKISGFEMLDILRNTDGMKEVKVIMLTALGQSDDQQRADKLGADRYLVKSQVTLEDIVKAAHDLLADELAATPAPTTSPAAPSAPTPAPAAPPQPPKNSAAASDDKLMDDAVKSLIADTEKKPAEPAGATVASPKITAASSATDSASKTDQTDDETQNVPVVHKKVIKPIEKKPEKDLDTLLAEEEAKESGAPAPVAPAPATPDGAASTAAEEASVDAKIEDFVAGASSDPTPPSTPAAPTPGPATGVKPAEPSTKPEDTPPASPDPNIIAL
ncbi:MAG TPA: response regulator [Candidatus Saccharimonadales bacterium]|nr:response regulator [Candidatus Saccharimonadales bacterium]